MKYWIAVAALYPASAFAGFLSDLVDRVGGLVTDTTHTVSGVVSPGGAADTASAPEINGSAAILAVTLVVGIASLLKRARDKRLSNL